MGKPTRIQDAEQNWQPGLSSAGMETRPLPTGRQRRRPNRIVAILPLLLLGSMFLLDRFALGSINWGLGALLLTLSICFFVAAVWQRNFAFCIPACILAGLSVGLPVAAVLGPVPLIWGLALGFSTLFFLGRALFNEREPWPLFLGGALFATKVFLLVFV